ncbi:MAG: N-formylglutamate amidohydrolase [Candidatus Eisenbacteria sp.]|nr:N-formylglutamate amidohydrolase [Candidatus Eisenbacteria bacterium]
MAPFTVFHIPHASRCVPPPSVRLTLPTDEAALARELLMLTDHFADELFAAGRRLALPLVYPVSRLAVDAGHVGRSGMSDREACILALCECQQDQDVRIPTQLPRWQAGSLTGRSGQLRAVEDSWGCRQCGHGIDRRVR